MSRVDEPRHEALMREALQRITELQARVRELEAARHEPLAIVGLACRFPGAPDPRAFWTLLHDGGDAITEIPRSRWDIDAWYDPNPDTPGKMHTRAGGFLDAIDRFDAAFFGISPREALMLDPQQRLLLETTWEALEHAGIAPESLAGSRGGVFVGIGGVDYYQRLAAGAAADIDAYVASGNAHSTASGRLSFTLNLHGPCVSIDTACSSSLVAVHLACQSLRQRECDLALAGGVNLLLSPTIHLNHSRARMLAADGRCKAFDAAADGFVRSEGCGVVVVKRAADAVRDGDRVLAIVRGTAVNQDGRTSALTVPNGPAQQAVIQAALADAGLRPSDVSYLEAHGTGTALGDPIELNALDAVFSGSRSAPLIVGSVKANIGHAEAAAGVAGLIKVVLAMQHRTIPPQLHFHRPNPRLEWDRLPLTVVTTPTRWDSGDRVLRAGVSAFGFGGTNAHLVLESASPAAADDRVPADRTGDLTDVDDLLVLSARSAPALRDLAASYAAHLAREEPTSAVQPPADDEPDTRSRIASLCWTAATGRNHFAHRLAIRADRLDVLRERLEGAAAGRLADGVWMTRDADADPGRIAFLFSGQGAQYWGMGRSLYERHRPFRDALEACAAALDPHLDLPLIDLLYGARGRDRLDQTVYTQPALFAIEHAMAALWRDFGIEPDAVLGHSIGELAAAQFAGVMSLEDAARLVAARGRLMQQQPRGAMAVLLTDPDAAAACMGEGEAVSIAAINGPAQVVVSGPEDAIAAVVDRATRRAIACRRLAVSHAFHSAMMDPMLDDLARAAGVAYAPPAVDIVSNLTGDVADADGYGPDYWVRHARRPVLFAKGVRTLWERGCRIFIEVGPDATLTALASGVLGGDTQGTWIASLRRQQDALGTFRDALAQTYVAGLRVDWRRGLAHARQPRVELPTYPFQRERYWVEPPSPAKSSDSTAAPSVVVPIVRGELDASAALDRLQYEIAWVDAERRDRQTPDSSAPSASRLAATGTWLVIAETAATALTIAGWLEASGARTVTRVIGTTATAMPDLDDAGDDVIAVVHGGALDLTRSLGTATPRAPVPADDIVEAATRVCTSIGAVLRAIERRQGPTRPRLWVLTRGAVLAMTGDDDAAAVAQAPVWGFGRVAALEHPAEWGGLIDLDPATEAPDPDLLARALTGDEDQVAISRGRLVVPRLRPVIVASPASSSSAAGRPAAWDGLRADASYLITGGLGALGLDVAEWMVDRGARHLILIGRTAPGDAARDRLAALRAAGAIVDVRHVDVTSEPEMRALVDRWPAERPLRGIVHAAGANGLAPVAGMDAATIARVLAAKVAGAWLLHDCTRDQPLEFFVAFSSIASVWGSKGQAHYAAANAFLDRLVAHRAARGLPALALNWGPWHGRGMSTRDAEGWLEKVGVRALAPAAALQAFERVLADGTRGARVIAEIEWPTFLALYQARRSYSLFRELAPREVAARVDTLVPAREDRIQELRAMGAAAGRGEIVRLVERELLGVLRLDPSHLPAPHQGFFTIGLDSLMALELRQRLGSALGVTLPSTVAFDHPTIRDLSTYLATEVVGLESPDTARIAAPATRAAGAAAAATATVTDPSVHASLTRLERLIHGE